MSLFGPSRKTLEAQLAQAQAELSTDAGSMAARMSFDQAALTATALRVIELEEAVWKKTPLRKLRAELKALQKRRGELPPTVEFSRATPDPPGWLAQADAMEISNRIRKLVWHISTRRDVTWPEVLFVFGGGALLATLRNCPFG